MMILRDKSNGKHLERYIKDRGRFKLGVSEEDILVMWKILSSR